MIDFGIEIFQYSSRKCISVKNCSIAELKADWIKSLQNLLIQSHFEAISIDFSPNIFRLSENFWKFWNFSKKDGSQKPLGVIELLNT